MDIINILKVIAFMSRTNFIFFCLVIGFVAIFYIMTMLPSQGFHDAGELQTVAPTFNIAHPTGYPTYILLGKIFVTIFPFGEIAWRVNLLSVIYSILTLIFAALFLVKLTNNFTWSLLGILILAFTQPFWNYAGIADTHTLNRMFLFLLLFLSLLLYQKWRIKIWFLYCLFFGLGLGNHLLLLYAIPAFLMWYISLIIQKEVRVEFKDYLMGSLGFMIGLSVYIILPIRGSLDQVISFDYSLQTWSGFYRHISGYDFQGLMYQGGLLTILINMLFGLISLYHLVGIGVIIGVIGILYGALQYTRVTLILLIMFFSFLLFSTNYPTSDPLRYYLSYISIFCLFISLGSLAIFNVLSKILPLGLRKIILSFVFLLLMLLPLQLIYHNFSIVDKSQDSSAKQYSIDIFNSVLPNSVILSWWHYSTPLWYRQLVLQERKDLMIINQYPNEWTKYVSNYIDKRPIYTVERAGEISRNYNLTLEGRLYRLSQK